MNDALDVGKNINKAGFIELLKNMFPKLQSVYGNMSYGSDWYERWNKGQRICSENYYSRYFTYAIPRGDISDQVIQALSDESEKWELDRESNPLNEILTPASSETLIKKLRHKSGEIGADASIALAVAITQKSDEISNPEVLYSWMTPFSQAAMLVSDLIQNVSKPDRADLAKKCIDVAPILEFKLEIFKWLKREDEKKPEKDAFSEESIDEIGKHLGKVIAHELKDKKDITLLAPASIPIIFYTLNKFVEKGYVNDYVDELILKDPESLIRIIDSYVPTAWGMESGVSHKSDFERDQYNSLTSELDASKVLNAIETHFPQSMEVSDDFPRLYDDDTEKGLLFLEQFVWLHKYVLRELEDTENDSDEKA
ncbi:hypothetical protein LCGC14_1468080 [marine sediment metagenome]|uniref:Uncharacterized protein n=1 Tax=marine sediment metagenome TaxID=412755 RepID=A0A0F9MF17_9ZZZZ